MRILGDFLDRITRVIDDNLLRSDKDADRSLEPFDVKGALLRLKFHQVQRSEIAGGVIEEEILAARIGGILPAGAFAGMPLVDGGIELHSGIAADVSPFGDFA